MNAIEIAPDVTGCDLEPIHIPGSIQPHGLLLIANARTLEIVAGAGDIDGRLTPNWLNRSLYDVLGTPIGTQLAGLHLSPKMIVAERVHGLSEIFDVLSHISGAEILVELEPAALELPPTIQVLATINADNGSFEQALDLLGVCDLAAEAVRRLTGFDRVMIYRFVDEGGGVVVAEAHGSNIGSFLNHHFPASDIPQQARALYVRNRIRVIPDVDYAPAPIGPGSEWRSIDLSDIGLRSVSPIHVLYLKNMGVQASASISIVRDGRLWGLVACHNRTPKRISYTARMACLALADGLSHQIRIKEDADNYRERAKLRSAEDAAMTQLSSGLSLEEFFALTGENLCRMLDADGFAVVRGEELNIYGKCPARPAILEIANWTADLSVVRPFSTSTLSRLFPLAAAYQDLASGLLAVTLPAEESIALLWFRAAQLEVVNWAGNPHKEIGADPEAILTPRSSFEAWSETVRGQSRPWSLLEIDAAGRLKRAVFEARQNLRLRQLNKKLAATIADKENLLRQKDYLIKEVNHRVQNSLQLVSSFLGLQARATGESGLTAHLEEAQRRLSAVALVHRRLYSDDQVEMVDLGRYLDDLCGDIKKSMGPAWAQYFTFDLTPVLTSTDRAINIGLILTELIINANKYAYAGLPGPIAISLEPQGRRFRLTVADKGTGDLKDHQGFGTRLMTAMVESLSGTIVRRDMRPGLHVSIDAPIEDSRLAEIMP